MYTFEKFSFTAGTLRCLHPIPVLHLYKVIQCTCMTFTEIGPDLLPYMYTKCSLAVHVSKMF